MLLQKHCLLLPSECRAPHSLQAKQLMLLSLTCGWRLLGAPTAPEALGTLGALWALGPLRALGPLGALEALEALGALGALEAV